MRFEMQMVNKYTEYLRHTFGDKKEFIDWAIHHTEYWYFAWDDVHGERSKTTVILELDL